MRYGIRQAGQINQLITWSLATLLLGLGFGTWSRGLPFYGLVIMATLCVIFFFLQKKLPQVFVLGFFLIGLVRGMTALPAENSRPPPTIVQKIVSERLAQSIGQPDAALAASLLTGNRQEIPKKTLDDFRASGLSHLLAVSGYNVTLIANALLWLTAKFLPKRWRTVLALLGVALFVWSVGSSAAVVRAGIMGSLAALVLHSGRTSGGKRALLIAAATMASLQPTLLLGDVGFQLSATATWAILFLVPCLLRHLPGVPDFLGLKSSIATSVAATLGTLPVVALVFGKISLIGVLANILAAPLVPLTMVLSTLAAVLGGSPMGVVAGFVAGSVVNTLTLVAQLGASLPGSQVLLPWPT